MRRLPLDPPLLSSRRSSRLTLLLPARSWYLTDGTYQGTVEDFKEAWPIVAAAVADNPLVRMFFTPNVAGGGVSDYEKYFPDDLSTVHYLG